MKRLELNQMEMVEGQCAWQGQVFTGLMCSSTFILIGTPFAPMAGATGFACIVGAVGGCAPAQ